MKKIILIICTLLILTNTPKTCLADQVNLFGIENLYNKLFVTKNPFEPQFPVKEVKQDNSKNTSIVDKIRGFVGSKQNEVSIEDVKKKLAKFNISGIIWHSDRPQAIVNRKIIDVGDTLDNMKVVAIRKSGVVVTFRGQSLTIRPK